MVDTSIHPDCAFDTAAGNIFVDGVWPVVVDIYDVGVDVVVDIVIIVINVIVDVEEVLFVATPPLLSATRVGRVYYGRLLLLTRRGCC